MIDINIALLIINVIFLAYGLVMILLTNIRKRDIIKRTRYESNIIKIDYSQKVLDTIKNLTSEITTLEFNKWENAHELNKSTISTERELFGLVALRVRGAIKSMDMLIEDTIYTESFLDQLIIDLSLTMVNIIFEDRINGGQN